MPIIKPTVGRVVHYYPNGSETSEQPLAAVVAHVNSDERVNIGYFDMTGRSRNAVNVPLVQTDDHVGGPHCRWMPYQKGQAVKTEQLEKQLADK